MTSPGKSPYLDLRGLAALENMRFTTRRRLEGAYSGRHASRQRGGAGEFVDYREYSDGEDVRRLDWKVLARSGRAYVRLYQDETNLLCTLAIDASGSMQFGGYSARNRNASTVKAANGLAAAYRSKLEYVQYLSTALSHVIGRGQDQVGLAVLTEQLAELIPPGSTPTHVARLQTVIERLATTPEQRMAVGLRQLFERSKRRGVLVLLSDFLMEDVEEVFAVLRLFGHRQWEVLALHVIHPDEERLPEALAYRFVGLENDGAIMCSPNEVREQYAERFANHLAMVRNLALGAACDYRRLSTGIDYLQTLRGFLVERTG